MSKLAAEILAKLLTIARRSRIQIDGVGVCVPGIVYSQTGRVWAPNIPGWGKLSATGSAAYRDCTGY